MKIPFRGLNNRKYEAVLCFTTCFSSKRTYLCAVKEEKKVRLFYSHAFQGWKAQKLEIMITMSRNEASLRMLAMLRYQAERYQSMGKGTMSQRLNAEIRRLLETMGAGAKN